MSILEKMFGGGKETPKNRPEDIEAARELTDESKVLNKDEERNKSTNEVIDNIAENPKESGDVGDILAQREEVLEESDKDVEGDRGGSMMNQEEALVQHSEKEDNNK